MQNFFLRHPLMTYLLLHLLFALEALAGLAVGIIGVVVSIYLFQAAPQTENGSGLQTILYVTFVILFGGGLIRVSGAWMKRGQKQIEELQKRSSPTRLIFPQNPPAPVSTAAGARCPHGRKIQRSAVDECDKCYWELKLRPGERRPEYQRIMIELGSGAVRGKFRMDPGTAPAGQSRELEVIVANTSTKRFYPPWHRYAAKRSAIPDRDFETFPNIPAARRAGYKLPGEISGIYPACIVWFFLVTTLMFIYHSPARFPLGLLLGSALCGALPLAIPLLAWPVSRNLIRAHWESFCVHTYTLRRLSDFHLSLDPRTQAKERRKVELMELLLRSPSFKRERRAIR